MKYFKLLFFILPFMLVACGDDEPESKNVNSVFAFSSSDKNVTVSNQGLNAVINLSALTYEYEIPITGTYLNADIVCDSKWLSAKIENKKLVLSLSLNYEDKMRSVNFAIKANDAEQIVIANVAVNQAGLTDDDKAQLETADIEYMLEIGGGAHPIPSDNNLEKHIWYTLNSEGTAYFRIEGRQDNSQVIHENDVVYPNYGVNTIENVLYGPNDWWMYPIVDNHHSNTPVTVLPTPSTQQIAEFGLGILLPLTKGLHFGDDVDLLLASNVGLPSLKDNKCAYIYVVQYNAKPIYPSAKSISRNNSLRLP